MDQSQDRQLLREIILQLEPNQVEQLLQAFADRPALAGAFRQRLSQWRQADDLRPLEQVIREEMENSSGQTRQFYAELIRFVDRARMTDAQVYRQVGMDRKLWYRLRDQQKARTSKENVLKMCIVLHLDYWETYYLVNLSGYAFTPTAQIDRTDFGVGLCVSNGIYTPMRVDELLVELGEPPLFAR